MLFITSDWPLDAGLAAANIENMAFSSGLGVLYNGYLARIAEANEEQKQWLGIKGKTLRHVCCWDMQRIYARTAQEKRQY